MVVVCLAVVCVVVVCVAVVRVVVVCVSIFLGFTLKLW